ncbi:MAG: hypothetical protein LC793_10880 [Thermomicrobia bacterium]|nr:hypothetical protein [Thermomicrobia bacterium]
MNGIARYLYLLSRTAGDLNALSRGRLGRRLVRREEYRLVFRLLRRIGL